MDRIKVWQMHQPARNMLIVGLLGTVIISAIFLSSRSVLATKLALFPGMTSTKTIAINGADQWNNDKTVMTPLYSFSLPISKQVVVSSLFSQYYQRPGVAKGLGDAVTEAFPINQGWLQFFGSGALLSPAKQQAQSYNGHDTLTSLINSGTKDASSGIVRLPLLQALLTVGSKVPIGGVGSSITYADLRKDANPNFMQLTPLQKNSSLSSSNGQSIFIKGGMRARSAVGHLVPQIVWNYVMRSGNWTEDFGLPLTEALPFTLTINGKTHHMLVQAFAYAGVVVDLDTKDVSGQPLIQDLPIGMDYLSTFGFPKVSVHINQALWVKGNEELLATPGGKKILAHVGQNFPLKLLGDVSWTGGMLWYHVQWVTPKGANRGWISAAYSTFATPGSVPGWASLDVLSPQLATYLATFGSNVGAVVYDVTRQHYYTYNNNTQFIVASSMKVPIMLTFFDTLEQQGLEPDDTQMNVLTTMIENSNNDSASDLYFNELGGAEAVTNYMKKIKVSGLYPDSGSWGYSMITPQTMVNLFTVLYQGKILTDQDRSIAYNLLENIESDQQVGVGDTAPTGFTVAMKDGWVTGPDNLWAMNTSGIVMSSKETYIVSVYTQEQQSLDAGQAIVRYVCSSLSSLLA